MEMQRGVRERWSHGNRAKCSFSTCSAARRTHRSGKKETTNSAQLFQSSRKALEIERPQLTHNITNHNEKNKLKDTCTVQDGTGLPAHNGVFMKNGTKKEWNPSPNIHSFSTSLLLSLFSSPPLLLCPGPADTFYYSLTAAMHSLTHSLSHRVNRVGSLSRLPIERVQHINTHKHALLSLRRATASEHRCHVRCIFVLMLSPVSQHTHTSVSQGPLITYCIATKTSMQASFSVFDSFFVLSITRQPCKQKGMVEYTQSLVRSSVKGGVTGYCRDPASYAHTQKHTASFLIFSSVSQKSFRLWTMKECDMLHL
ncbi:hypothetical protein QQF64_002329 [Cirrhinus molitorella]|uniref:Uncharacterized protein n=1 Tax=Cirrhinus molitorella TaxID=172907 RepID=A0ABR3MPU3_9TELE